MKTFRKYFSFDNQDANLNLGISLLNIGHHLHPANTHYPDVQHPDSHYFEWEKGRSLKEYQILYICKGEGTFESSGMPPQHIAEGTVVLLYPGIWHRYKPKENTGWEEYWIGFSGSYAHHLLEQECFNPQNPIIKVGFNAELLQTFTKLIELVEVKKESNQKIASFILLQVLGILYTSALITNQKVSRREKIIISIKKEIDEIWDQSIDFEQLAKKYGLSYVWFRKTFKEITGTSPNQYILMLKLRKAEQMLYDSNLTISEISFKCGFESEFYFSRIFKSKMKINASEIRKLAKTAK